MKILYLTLKKKWFDLIASGEKTEEYREIKPYWTKRLYKDWFGDEFYKFDEVHFKNGYSKKSPFMRVECKGIVRGCSPVYVIKLGKILEIKNYEIEKQN